MAIRKISGRFLALTLYLCLQSTLIMAQTRPTSDVALTQTVILNVRVTNSESHSVSDVPREDFRVTEDGMPQTISFFSKEDIPLTYALVIDTSASLRSQIDSVVATAATVVNNNQPGDETLLIRFIGSNKIEKIQDFTSDKKALIDGLDTLYIEGRAVGST